jgi:hypothetical protein
LIAASSSQYFAAHPWPDLGDWRAIRDPQQRLERALDELYAYYERTEPMFSNVLRDAALVDFAREAVVPLREYLEEATEARLSGGRSAGEGDNSSRERRATRWPSPPGAHSRPTALGDRMRWSSSPRSSKPLAASPNLPNPRSPNLPPRELRAGRGTTVSVATPASMA